MCANFTGLQDQQDKYLQNMCLIFFDGVCSISKATIAYCMEAMKVTLYISKGQRIVVVVKDSMKRIKQNHQEDKQGKGRGLDWNQRRGSGEAPPKNLQALFGHCLLGVVVVV